MTHAHFQNRASLVVKGEPVDWSVIERYLRVPNRAVLIYTTEDRMVWDYVCEFWKELDALSGECCDIYASQAHLQGEESGYSFLRQDSEIPGMSAIKVSSLPCLHVWSATHWVTVPLGVGADRAQITSVLRAVFDELKRSSVPLNAESARRILRAVEKRNMSESRGRTSDLMAILMLAMVLMSVVIVALVVFSELGVASGLAAVVSAAVLYALFGALMLRYVGRMTEQNMLKLIGMSFSFGLRGIKELTGARGSSGKQDESANRARKSAPRAESPPEIVAKRKK